MKQSYGSLGLIVPPADQYDAEQFSYPGLEEAVKSNYAEEYGMVETYLERHSDDFWKIIDLKDVYRYLPVLSLKIQQADDRESQQYWSDQYTLATSRIFGRPETNEARRLASGSLVELEQIAEEYNLPNVATNKLFSVYRSIAKSRGMQDSIAGEEVELLRNLGSILRQRYGFVYQATEDVNHSDQPLDARETSELFGSMLSRLSKQDGVWADWYVKQNNSAQMSVTPKMRRINVGKYLPGLSVRRAKSLFTHEVLVHAARTVHGLAYARNLAYGLPGYTEAEEGLGVLMEAAIEGRMPYRIVDRYVDIALALGILGRPPMPRLEMFELVRQRTLLRRLVEKSGLSQSEVDRISWQHVNRIYKGSLGNEVIGVNTRDTIYYNGYRTMAEYLSRYRGRDLHNAVRFVLSGKMNPVSQKHRAYIHKLKFNISN